MTVGKLGGVLLSVALVGLAALLVYAWVDGGREPVRDIVVEIPVSGAGQ